MKQLPLTRLAILLAIIVLAGNCRKSEISFESDNISFSVSGRVLDKDHVPVGGAQVKAGAVAGITDADGNFTLNGVRAPKDAAYVTVEKNGYFTGSRTFLATTNAMNFVNIRLIPKQVTGTFSATGGGPVNLTSGGSINFQANSIVDATTNAAYTGTVSIASYFIDPTENDFATIMPGDLRGVTASNVERGLQSFGMMAVELSGAGGQKLQLASGKNATVSFPIPAALRGHAPATIPLWHFDEATGFWKEEGSATRQGNMYVGTVGHFSFWNCDAPFPLVDFEVTIRDQNGVALVNAQVTIKKISDSTVAYGYTNANGFVRGKIPANEPLVMKVKDRCNTVLLSQNIGPFSSNTNLGILTVAAQNPTTVMISGSVVNCSSAPVTQGYVNAYLDGVNYRGAITNGSFSISISRCNNTPAQVHLTAIDQAANQQSATQTIAVTSGNVNVGQISACGVSAAEFINFTLDGTNYAFTPPGDSVVCYVLDSLSIPARTNIIGFNAANELVLQFTNIGSGYITSSLKVSIGTAKYTGSQGVPVNITQFGNSGDFVAGNLTTTVTNGTNTYPFTCSFKVRRQ